MPNLKYEFISQLAFTALFNKRRSMRQMSADGTQLKQHVHQFHAFVA